MSPADCRLGLPRPHVQIDVDPAALGRTYPTDLGITGDAASTVAALVDLLPDRTATDAGWLSQVAAARRLARQGLRDAIGAALAEPDLPTLALVGDGGLAVHFGELMTLAQERPWVVLLVFNDRGYGVLRNTQDVHLARRSGVDLTTPDFAGIAAALGLGHWRATSVDQVEEALAEGLATRGPVVVEVDVDALGPMPRPFTPPVTIGV